MRTALPVIRCQNIGSGTSLQKSTLVRTYLFYLFNFIMVRIWEVTSLQMSTLVWELGVFLYYGASLGSNQVTKVKL